MMKMREKKQDIEPWSAALNHLRSSDTRLAELIERIGPCQLRPKDDYLATLAQSIISQQISAKAAQTIFARVCEVMPSPWTIASTGLLTSDFLQNCGVSQQKRNYLLSLIDQVGSGQLELDNLSVLEDEAIISELTKVKGIGRWTAEMFLIFALNRPDVLPVADLGIKQALKLHFDLKEMPKPVESENLTQHWRPYRSVAMWYLWRMFD